jgi:hypothetical protein
LKRVSSGDEPRHSRCRSRFELYAKLFHNSLEQLDEAQRDAHPMLGDIAQTSSELTHLNFELAAARGESDSGVAGHHDHRFLLAPRHGASKRRVWLSVFNELVPRYECLIGLDQRSRRDGVARRRRSVFFSQIQGFSVEITTH